MMSKAKEVRQTVEESSIDDLGKLSEYSSCNRISLLMYLTVKNLGKIYLPPHDRKTPLPGQN